MAKKILVATICGASLWLSALLPLHGQNTWRGHRPSAAQLAWLLYQHALWLDHYTGQRADLSGVNLAASQLRTLQLAAAKLCGANFAASNLIAANFAGADLSAANFKMARLHGANLWRANLTGSDFSGAQLQGATLQEANLNAADLSSTDLATVKLQHARYDRDTIFPKYFDPQQAGMLWQD